MIQDLSNELVAQGHDVTLITEKTERKLNLVAMDPRVHLREVPTFRYFVGITVIPWYVFHLAREQFDHVVIFFAGRGIGPAIRMTNLIRPLNWHMYLCYSSLAAPHRYEEFRLQCLDKKAKSIICVSSLVAAQAKSYFARPVSVVTPGIDTNRLRPDHLAGSQLRRRLKISPETPLIISAGAFEPRKNMHRVIEAIPLLLVRRPNLRCLLIGEGNQRPVLEGMIKNLKLTEHVQIVDPQEDMVGYYNAADVFVFLGENEASITGLVTWEALACGVPVVFVSCDSTENQRWCDFSVLLDEPDPAKVAAAVDALLADPQKHLRRGEMGRDFVKQNFSLQHVTREFAQVLQTPENNPGQLYRGTR